MARASFGFSTTTIDVLEGIDLHGTRVLVTGGTAGLGGETTRALRSAGAEVTATTRADLDLADLASVRRFGEVWEAPLDILVNNAGGILPELQRTPQGWEKQFATNHLGHFALAVGLRRWLKPQARIVTLSSSGHLASPVIFDDIHFRYRPYTDQLAYGQSKTANVLFGVEASTRWGVLANAAMPGPTYTGFQRNMDPSRLRERAQGADLEAGEIPPGWKSLEQGAATTVFAATRVTTGGGYLEDCHEAEIVDDNNGYRSGVAPYALDRQKAERLWRVSERMLAAS